jgi:hypothetical protein
VAGFEDLALVLIPLLLLIGAAGSLIASVDVWLATRSSHERGWRRLRHRLAFHVLLNAAVVAMFALVPVLGFVLAVPYLAGYAISWTSTLRPAGGPSATRTRVALVCLAIGLLGFYALTRPPAEPRGRERWWLEGRLQTVGADISALVPALSRYAHHMGQLPADLEELTKRSTNRAGRREGPYLGRVPEAPSGWSGYAYAARPHGTVTISVRGDGIGRWAGWSCHELARKVSVKDLRCEPDGTIRVTAVVPSRGIELAPGVSYVAVAADLAKPRGLFATPSGDLYLVEQASGSVSKLTPGGEIVRIAGGLSAPQAVVLDDRGDLYVADTGANRLARVSPDSAVTTHLLGLAAPVAIGFNPRGELLVCEVRGRRVIALRPAAVRVAAPPLAAGSHHNRADPRWRGRRRPASASSARSSSTGKAWPRGSSPTASSSERAGPSTSATGQGIGW